ncbi:MAG: flagellar hook-associated protein FlgK [Thermodesulfobacteriota bacterium]|nr:flagellar hook-associated protein FlgK [Thermodesulfobacteriota bacterium]
MPGISSVLNIAKEALLAHQMSISVSGHNVANVDTPGYSRQTLALQTSVPTPEGVGFFGNGVRGERIARHYDQFMVQSLTDQNAVVSGLKSQQQSMRVVETIFNEAPGLALNDLMSAYWESWQELTDHPELLSARQNVVQQAELINAQLQSMSAEVIQSRHDIGISIQSNVDNVNSLAQQISQLNGQISSNETDIKKQNDLRDTRDQLLKEMSEAVEINYFETNTGAYTIMLTDGHTLVENNESWGVKWKDDKLHWLSKAADGTATEIPIGSGHELGGAIGGQMEVYGHLAEDNPDNYYGRLNALANSFIREVNQLHAQGVGMVRFSEQITGSELAVDTTLLNADIDETLASTTITAGSMEINGRSIGRIEGSFATEGLAMGKAYNTATAINDAICGVNAKLTTQVAGDVITTGLLAGESVAFTINGIDVSYTAAANETTTQTANNVVGAINSAIDAYNLDPAHSPKMTLEAVSGDGNNGGAFDSIILRNTNAGDESRIIIDGAEDTALELQLGLTNGTYVADATHNTGIVSMFSDEPITIAAGTDDRYIEQLGLGGGNISSTDDSGDGKLLFTKEDNMVAASLQGFKYANELQTDDTSFKIWLYNDDDTLALAQPVEVSIERAYTLGDVAGAINAAISNASGESQPWVAATVAENKLVLTPDTSHKFAFGGDETNLLATAGINTFFSGHSANTIGVNELIVNDLDNLAVGTVSENGEIYQGDNSNGLLITNIQRNEYVQFTGGITDTLDGFYNALVGEIGLTGKTVDRDLEFNSLVIDQMNAMRDNTSGVSLDEEMANLIKFQHAYSAAAKLITTSDEMLQTLLNSV